MDHQGSPREHFFHFFFKFNKRKKNFNILLILNLELRHPFSGKVNKGSKINRTVQ